MENDIQTLENFIRTNLNQSCCSNNIIVTRREGKTDGEPHVILYKTICNACDKDEPSKPYPLKLIYDLNKRDNRPGGIICRDCKGKKCNTEGCVISLIVKKYKNNSTLNCFTKIDKIEIIYI